MFLANHIPKCQVSSGPYGPIFKYQCSGMQACIHFWQEYNLQEIASSYNMKCWVGGMESDHTFANINKLFV